MELAFILLLLLTAALITGAAYGVVIVIFWRELSRNIRDARARIDFNALPRSPSTIGARSRD